MNYKLLLLGLISASIITSCSTAYKMGQTPDDVYYSPATDNVAKRETKNDRYEDYARNEEDQYLRMKVRNRGRWNTIDDYEYWYDSRYNYNNYYNQYVWNNWHYGYGRPYWNNYYYSGWYPGWGNGYVYPVVINKYQPRPSNVNRPPLRGYNNNAGYNNNNISNTIRKVFSNNGSTYNNTNAGNTYTPPSRTYNPSSGSSSSGSSSGNSSSSGAVSRPSRGGN